MSGTNRFMDAALEEAIKAKNAMKCRLGPLWSSKARLSGVAETKPGRPTMSPPMRKSSLFAWLASFGQERLPGADLYVTLEPCTMCAAAISFARIRRLYYGARDAKGGAVESGVRFFDQPTCHHAPDVYSGLAETETSRLLVDFFQAKRTR